MPYNRAHLRRLSLSRTRHGSSDAAPGMISFSFIRVIGYLGRYARLRSKTRVTLPCYDSRRWHGHSASVATDGSARLVLVVDGRFVSLRLQGGGQGTVGPPLHTLHPIDISFLIVRIRA